MRSFLMASALTVIAGAALLGPRAQADAARALPAPALDLPPGSSQNTIVLSGGCFWGVQGVFEHVKGVTRAVSGYAGGQRDTAEYETVSTGATGHAESVKITYDPREISLGRILQVFFSVAMDPTQVGGQGPDHGPQYRSEIWTVSADEARIARAYIAQLNRSHILDAPVSTRVDTLPAFYPAEDYHQDYLTNHPDNPYIAYVDMPKLAALKSAFPSLWREQPVKWQAGS